jgi:hypothetical protein
MREYRTDYFINLRSKLSSLFLTIVVPHTIHIVGNRHIGSRSDKFFNTLTAIQTSFSICSSIACTFRAFRKNDYRKRTCTVCAKRKSMEIGGGASVSRASASLIDTQDDVSFY